MISLLTGPINDTYYYPFKTLPESRIVGKYLYSDGKIIAIVPRLNYTLCISADIVGQDLKWPMMIPLSLMEGLHLTTTLKLLILKNVQHSFLQHDYSIPHVVAGTLTNPNYSSAPTALMPVATLLASALLILIAFLF